MSSSPFPILDNRPIDKWKVTELKEELKRRRLTTQGLKLDLVRRLDDALRAEQQESERLNNAALAAAVEANQQPEIAHVPEGNVAPDPMQTTPGPTEIKTTTEASAAIETPPPPVLSNPDVNASGLDDVRDVAGLDTPVVDVNLQEPQKVDVKDGVETGVTATGAAVAEEASNEQIIEKSDVEMENKETFSGLDSKAQPSEAVLENSATHNQVSEVIPVSGFEVKSDCISTDCVSNNEKIELKGNEIADNVKLEHSVNKSQEPSTVIGESHPMDVEKPLEHKISVGGGDDSDAANADMTKENNIVDAGDSEKLNLDRSSGDESMDDEPETKQTESVTSHEVVDKSKKVDLLPDKADTMDAGKGEAPDNKSHPLVASDKRKLPVSDQEAVGNNEPAKRRRWNSGSIKVPEAQATNSMTPTTTPNAASLKPDFSRSDSSVSEDGPKERVVPPSPKEPTNSLRIDRFLRPFTLKSVQELLSKTGNVTSFWMDNIKTHCYVSYASVEEAAATREAVYNIQWPPNGGRLLTAEFVGPEEVKAKLEAPPPQPQAQSPLQPPPTALPPPPPLAKAPPAKERHALPPPPPLIPEEQEPPIVTLDDLFKKTKAIPRIYYLPLSEDQVAAKLAANNK